MNAGLARPGCFGGNNQTIKKHRREAPPQKAGFFLCGLPPADMNVGLTSQKISSVFATGFLCGKPL